MKNTAPITLHGYWRSSCSWRVRIALNIKGLEYQTVPVHLVADGGQQHGLAHRSLNPMRELPVLVVDGEPIAQSVAILEFLEERYQTPPLLPKSSLGRAKVRQFVEIINSGIQPLQNLRVMQRLGLDFGFDKASQRNWSKGWIKSGFEAFALAVEKVSGEYCFGDEVTLADLCLVPQLYNARRFDVNVADFPNLLEIEARLAKHSAFLKAHPDNQPDAP